MPLANKGVGVGIWGLGDQFFQLLEEGVELVPTRCFTT